MKFTKKNQNLYYVSDISWQTNEFPLKKRIAIVSKRENLVILEEYAPWGYFKAKPYIKANSHCEAAHSLVTTYVPMSFWDLPQNQPINFYLLDIEHRFFKDVTFCLIVHEVMNTPLKEESWFKRNIYWKLSNISNLGIQYCNAPPSEVNFLQRIYSGFHHYN